tara:strand:+ start:45 stop:176 length:132 start_codon:yes stop_codon:yes gene_type:complete
MIKKIIFTLVLCCIIFSCGKKGDPEYIDPEQKTEVQTSFINKT